MTAPAAGVSAWKTLQKDIITCRSCPRLVAYGHEIATVKRRAFREWDYWGQPVPNLGEPKVSLLIIGLAPAAHGAHRTGRAFTGDQSGVWLYRALHKAGFANQPHSDDITDGLKLIDATLTMVGHCAPPQNKLTPAETASCRPFLTRTWDLAQPRVVLALGQVAWKASLRELESRTATRLVAPPFTHGAEVQLAGTTLLGSYHPSQQNTFTGKLTEPMLDAVLARARALVADTGHSKAKL